jgi:hypothetical protein
VGNESLDDDEGLSSSGKLRGDSKSGTLSNRLDVADTTETRLPALDVRMALAG